MSFAWSPLAGAPLLLAPPIIPPVGPAGVLTLVPTVEAGATITLSWLTNVIKFWSGKEQRIGINAHPRQRIEFSTKLTDAEHRTMLAALSRYAHTAPVFLLALPHEALPIASSTAVALTVHDLSMCDWNVAGQRIVVVHPDGTRAEAVVQTPPGGNVIAVDEDLSAVAVDGAQVMPLVGVHLEPNQALGRYRVNMGQWDLVAHVILPWFGASTTVGAGAAITEHDSMAVWEAGNQQRFASQPLNSGIELVDLGGRIDALSSFTASKWTRTLRTESNDPAGWQYLKAFLVAAHGMRKAWLLPTARPDLVAVGDASSGTLTVSDESDYVASWFPSLAHRRVKIVLATGAVHYRTISACVDNGDGTQGLTLNAALVGAIARVELLETVRFDADEVVVEWGGGWQFAAELTAKVIQHTADTDPATYDSDEASTENSRPVELYEFAGLPSGTAYLTSYDIDYTHAAQLYTSIPNSRDNLREVPTGQLRELTITLPIDHAVSQALIGNGIPPRTPTLTITRVQQRSGESREVWSGEITSCQTDGQYIRISVPDTWDVAMKVRLPIARDSRGCQHPLYGPGCLATRVDAATTVDSISADGLTITVAAYAFADQHARLGDIARVSDGERRSILAQVGTAITIDVPFGTLENLDAVTIAPGCDKAITTCRDKFDNVPNFGGHPNAPLTNPMSPLKGKAV